MDWQSLGRLFVGIGVLLLVIGLLFVGLGRFFHIGSLPGDIVYKKGNFTFYFPVVTCLVVSLIITLLLKFVFRK